MEPTRSTPRCPGPYGLAGGWNGRATAGTGDSGHPNRATGAGEGKARGAAEDIGTGAAGGAPGAAEDPGGTAEGAQDAGEGAQAAGGAPGAAEDPGGTAEGAQDARTGAVSGASRVSRTAITAVAIRAGMGAGWGRNGTPRGGDRGACG
jgi:hypothetical protein